MQPVSKEDIKKMIEEAKAAGKDVSELETLKDEELKEEKSVPTGRKLVIQDDGQRAIIIESTGPAREDDFDE